MAETQRQKMMKLLEQYTLDFEELRAELGLKRKELEEELHHLEKTVKRKKGALTVTPSICMACGYEFSVRRDRPFQAPRRCPSCKEERVSPPAFRVVWETD